jgi:predicted DsbA family dithiol-disulfide isomerase
MPPIVLAHTTSPEDRFSWPHRRPAVFVPTPAPLILQTTPNRREVMRPALQVPRKRLVTGGVGSDVSLKVEIWSDVVCPWCYIGKRRFEAALARFEHRDEVELVWRSFELDVSAPPSSDEQGSYVERIASKYGCSLAQAQAMVEEMTATAAREGLDFRFDLARPGNTFDAHRLLHLALEHGRQDELKERLDAATFTEGSPPSDHRALRALATQVGLPEVDVDAVLTSDRYSEAVRGDEAQARKYGISGVPFFVIDGRYGISGAQPADAVLATLDKAWSERPPLTLVAQPGSAPSCEGDSCAM